MLSRSGACGMGGYNKIIVGEESLADCITLCGWFHKSSQGSSLLLIQCILFFQKYAGAVLEICG